MQPKFVFCRHFVSSRMNFLRIIAFLLLAFGNDV